MGPVDVDPVGAAAPPGRRDRGGIVLGWLVRLTVVLAVTGLVAADGLSIAVTRMTTADAAADAAARAGEVWAQTRQLDAAYAAAVDSARIVDTDALVPRSGFRVGPDGSVRLVVVRTARTLIASQVTLTSHWAVVERTGRAAPGA